MSSQAIASSRTRKPAAAAAIEAQDESLTFAFPFETKDTKKRESDFGSREESANKRQNRHYSKRSLSSITTELTAHVLNKQPFSTFKFDERDGDGDRWTIPLLREWFASKSRYTWKTSRISLVLASALKTNATLQAFLQASSELPSWILECIQLGVETIHFIVKDFTVKDSTELFRGTASYTKTAEPTETNQATATKNFINDITKILSYVVQQKRLKIEAVIVGYSEKEKQFQTIYPFVHSIAEVSDIPVTFDVVQKLYKLPQEEYRPDWFVLIFGSEQLTVYYDNQQVRRITHIKEHLKLDRVNQIWREKWIKLSTEVITDSKIKTEKYFDATNMRDTEVMVVTTQSSLVRNDSLHTRFIRFGFDNEIESVRLQDGTILMKQWYPCPFDTSTIWIEDQLYKVGSIVRYADEVYFAQRENTNIQPVKTDVWTPITFQPKETVALIKIVHDQTKREYALIRPRLSQGSTYTCMLMTIYQHSAKYKASNYERDSALERLQRRAIESDKTQMKEKNKHAQINLIARDGGCESLVITPEFRKHVGAIVVNFAKEIARLEGVIDVSLKDEAQVRCKFMEDENMDTSSTIPNAHLILSEIAAMQNKFPWYSRFGFLPNNTYKSVLMFYRDVQQLTWVRIAETIFRCLRMHVPARIVNAIEAIYALLKQANKEQSKNILLYGSEFLCNGWSIIVNWFASEDNKVLFAKLLDPKTQEEIQIKLSLEALLPQLKEYYDHEDSLIWMRAL